MIRRGVLCRAMLAWVALAGLAHAQSAASEEQVKAAFLYRFASFVQWPEGAFSAPDAPLKVCVIGRDPFGAVLDRAVANQAIDGHPVVLQRLSGAANARECHIAYVSGNVAEATLRATRNAPTLTVTDAADGDGARGVIHFVMLDKRVRFHIDDALAADSRLSISSRLLALGLSVRRRDGR